MYAAEFAVEKLTCKSHSGKYQYGITTYMSVHSHSLPWQRLGLGPKFTKDLTFLCKAWVS